MPSRFAALFQVLQLHISTLETVARIKLRLSAMKLSEGKVCGTSCRSGNESELKVPAEAAIEVCMKAAFAIL